MHVDPANRNQDSNETKAVYLHNTLGCRDEARQAANLGVTGCRAGEPAAAEERPRNGQWHSVETRFMCTLDCTVPQVKMCLNDKSGGVLYPTPNPVSKPEVPADSAVLTHK